MNVVIGQAGRRVDFAVLAPVLLAALLAVVLAGCAAGSPGQPGSTAADSSANLPTRTFPFPTPTDTGLPTAVVPTNGYATAPGMTGATGAIGPTGVETGVPNLAAPMTSTPGAVPTTGTPRTVTNGAIPAPSWLGTRVLKAGTSRATPAELVNRRIITTDLLPPPTDGRFHSSIVPVPVAVLDRSTWSELCPVSLADLRYVTVSFRGFDGLPHTGELLVNRTVASDVVTVFQKLFTADWPIEQMRIVTEADFYAPSTGDGNNTSAFACRPVTGSKTTWSMHAYGKAIDLNPFHNPYLSGRTIIPELAKAYLNRDRRVPGINTSSSVPVRAFRAIGWGWGGNFRSKKDWMHFSSNGT